MTSIALIAYSCDPTRGSESLIGWKWATLLSAHFDVTVVTHPRNRASIMNTKECLAGGSLRFEFVSLPKSIDPWEKFPAERWMSLRYTAWQLMAAKRVLQLRRTRYFQAIHHCSWATLTGPTFAWATGLPFIWGPIGGGQTTPLSLAAYLGDGSLGERVRNLRLRFLEFLPWVRLAAKRANVVFASNQATYDALRRVGSKDVRLLPDTAIPNDWQTCNRTQDEAGTPQLVWVGRLLSRKAPLLALEVLARVLRHQNAKLIIVGDGPQRCVCEARVKALRIGRHVEFTGSIPHDEVPQILARSDIFLFTSIRDSFPQVVLEALAYGIPAVLLNHNGAEMLPSNAVITVPVSAPEETADAFAAAVLKLLSSKSLRRTMSDNALKAIGEEHLWKHRLHRVLGAYKDILAAPRSVNLINELSWKTKITSQTSALPDPNGGAKEQ